MPCRRDRAAHPRQPPGRPGRGGTGNGGCRGRGDRRAFSRRRRISSRPRSQRADPGDALREELAREQRVEAVLDAVGSRVPAVSARDVEIFYLLHRERFQSPELRTLRHILITINEDLSSNTREAAFRRITQIHALLQRHPERFAEQALQHSECPTSMQGGLLGQLPAGKLFPSLDVVAATLRSGELSGPVESPMGFHLLRCENRRPASMLPLASVRTRIAEQILAVRSENARRRWIRSLLAQ
ncbi:nitrogen fixation protein NifM [Candidatus Dactylopiibacterium carminicum]|uniref:nitrogen fixation protein NifM n=1 Tax=Candidatus Dactylopiibacterium carminicum TaxID=857335 RepID=UPI001CC28C35|nr:nitrogen fixation protein NifM [Candidatus Dactylopiibacterium carminicum]